MFLPLPVAGNSGRCPCLISKGGVVTSTPETNTWLRGLILIWSSCGNEYMCKTLEGIWRRKAVDIKRSIGQEDSMMSKLSLEIQPGINVLRMCRDNPFRISNSSVLTLFETGSEMYWPLYCLKWRLKYGFTCSYPKSMPAFTFQLLVITFHLFTKLRLEFLWYIFSLWVKHLVWSWFWEVLL